MNDSMITFSGWVGSRLDVVQVGDGVAVSTFRVGSTPRRFRDGRWENGETLWYSVKAWRSLATNAAASLRVGDPVVVTGRLVAETWTKDDGTVQTRHVVVAVTIGHDLNRGASTFTRLSQSEAAEPVAPAAPAAPTGRSERDGEPGTDAEPDTGADDRSIAGEGQAIDDERRADDRTAA